MAKKYSRGCGKFYEKDHSDYTIYTCNGNMNIAFLPLQVPKISLVLLQTILHNTSPHYINAINDYLIIQ